MGNTRTRDIFRKAFLQWSVATTVVGEVATIMFRATAGYSAAEFNATGPPFVLQIHHMFWAVPFFLVAVLLSSPKPRGALFGIGVGCVASDLIHHFAVLPLWVGNTGWHWP